MTHFANVKFTVGLGVLFFLFLIWGHRPPESPEGLQGQSLLFGTCCLLGEAACKIDALGKVGAGHLFNSGKEQLVWISFPFCLLLPSSLTQGEEDLSRRSQQHEETTFYDYGVLFSGLAEFTDWQRGPRFYMVNFVRNLLEPLSGESSSNSF